MTTLLMVNSSLKGFEVPQCFGSIQIWLHKADLRSVKVQREKRAKKQFRVAESKICDLLLWLKQIIRSFKYVALVYVEI